MTDTRRCGGCSHGEAHGFNRVAQRSGRAVTVSFWCPLKRHHDVAGEACELYAAGENRRVYDDAGRAADGIASDLATYSNTGQAVDKWTAESVRELVMDCSRRGREDGDGCWHIEGEPQHWQRLADELNAAISRQKAKAHPYGYEPDTGAFDVTRCECGCLNDISATYCNDCGGVIEVDVNAEKEIYKYSTCNSVFATKHDDGSLEFGGKRYVAATRGGGKCEVETMESWLPAEQYHRCKHCGAFFAVMDASGDIPPYVCPNCGKEVKQ